MEPFTNSLDAVSERDFVLDLIYACAVLGVHLSRLGEEWVLWTSAEFGFATIDDAYSSGSSIMPQKKTPMPTNSCAARQDGSSGTSTPYSSPSKASRSATRKTSGG